jgi:DNA-binding response OmpR family regulator
MVPRSEGEAGRSRAMPQAFVVEDDVMMLRLLSEVTASNGLDPTAFTRLSSARSELRRRVPALLVVDDDLPDGRGADLVRELRANARTRGVRVIFCTGAPSSRCRELERMAPVVHKPFSIDEFERALGATSR